MTEAAKPVAADRASGSRSGKRGKDRNKKNASKIRAAGQASRLAKRIMEQAGITNPFTGNGLTLLQCVYKDPRQPAVVRLQAAQAAMPFESPRLNSVELSGNLTMTHEEALKKLAGK